MTAATPFLADNDMPFPHNPILRLPRLNTLAVSYAFRFDEGQAVRLAEWCNGTVAVEGSAQVVITGGTPSTTARVGDYVVETYGNEGPPWYVTVDPERFVLNWWPKGYTPDWEWRCYQRWDQPQPDPNPPTTPNLEAADFPAAYNPVEYLPWLDTTVEVQVFQLRPALQNQLAEWCDGEVVIEDGWYAVQVPGGLTVHNGEYLLLENGEFTVKTQDEFYNRYWPVGTETGWSVVCYKRSE